VRARSVPLCRVTWYCSSLSAARHSASLFSILPAIGLPILSPMPDGPHRPAVRTSRPAKPLLITNNRTRRRGMVILSLWGARAAPAIQVGCRPLSYGIRREDGPAAVHRQANAGHEVVLEERQHRLGHVFRPALELHERGVDRLTPFRVRQVRRQE